MNMNFDKIIRITFVILFICFFWSLTIQKKLIDENKKMLNEVSIQKKQMDSLEAEIFTYELKLFRYERAIEIYEERNPSATSQLNDIISDETE